MNTNDEINRRIRARMSELGAKQTQLAEALNTDKASISELLNGKKGRKWSVRQVRTAAEFLKVPTSFLLEDAQSPMVSMVANLNPIMVIGNVQAGVFKEAFDWPEDDKYPIVVPIKNGELAAKCFGLVVDGPSMNKVYPDGTIVVICPLSYYQASLKTGDRVLVKRNRAGAVEVTVKELEIKDGKALLWPKSNDPRYQSAVDIAWPYSDPQKAGIDIVEIDGIVVSSVFIEKRI